MADICIACGNDKNLTLYEKNSFLGYPVRKCNKCGLYFFFCNDIEIAKRCNELYRGDYWSKFRKHGEEKRRLMNFIIRVLRSLNTHPLQQLFHHNIMMKYGQSKKLKSLLEVGCGKGESLIYFSKVGFYVKGVEPDPNNAKNINKYFGSDVCVNGLAEKIGIEGKFDVVYLCHVFEHLIRPDLFIEKIKKNLNEEGVIFIEVPNCENEKILHISIDCHPHIYSFTYNSIKKLFETHNYKVLKIGTFSEMHKSYIIKFFLMLFKLNNYKEVAHNKGESIYILAKKKYSRG